MLSVRQLTDAMNVFLSQGRKLRKNPQYREENRQRTLSQIKYEQKRLSINKICTVADPRHLELLEGLDKESLGEELQKNFFDHSLMEAFRCSLNVILDRSEGEASSRDRIKEFIEKGSRFGANSVNGIAIKSSINERHNIDMFVMKAPRSIFKSHEMIHEVIIGLEGLNDLRIICPNFSYTFDAFSCSFPITDEKKNIVEWCVPGSKPVDYAIYENINQAIPISDVSSAEELLLTYLQVLLALKLAHQHCDFTHYDAHDGNVLLRTYSDMDFYIPYTFNGIEIYLKTQGRIATFIDYGMSHIRTKDNINIGILDNDGFFNSTGTYSETSNVIGDAYKLICMILLHSKIKNQIELLKECKRILGYFFSKTEISDQEVNIILNEQWDNRFQIDISLTKQWNLDDFITYCIGMALERDPKSIVETMPSIVLQAINTSEVAAIEEISDLKIDIPTPYDLYESKGRSDLVQKFKKNIKLALELEQRHLAKYLKYVYREQFYAIPSNEADIIQHKDIYEHSIINVASLIEMYDEVQENIKYLNMAVKVSERFKGLYDAMIAKEQDLKSAILTLKPTIIMGNSILMTIIFGFIDREPTEIEIEVASKHPLYSLMSNYRIIIGQLSLVK